VIGTYHKFEALPDDVKVLNKIKSKARIDCTKYIDNVQGGYNGLTYFVNHKRQLFLYKTPAKDFINTDSRRLAEWSITGDGLNLSSIYIDDIDFPEFGYGYPNANRLLKNGTQNPLFEFRNDGYLFIMNKDYSQIELLIIPDGRNLINSYYQKLIDGGFDDELKALRQQATQFYQYIGLSL
jgi:hypothetical protein